MKNTLYKSCLSLVLLTAASCALATEFTVNSVGDVQDAKPGDGVCETVPDNNICTLRAAIQETNAYPGHDTIVVPSGVYTLVLRGFESVTDDSFGDLDITDSVDIQGAGADTTVIQAGASLGELRDRVFDVVYGNYLNMSDITIEHGAAMQTMFPHKHGGAIRSYGHLTLKNCVVQNNITARSVDGGGVYLGLGKALIENCIFKGNKAGIDGNGGAVYAENQIGNTLVIRHSQFIRNKAYNGGAVWGGVRTLVENSLFETNSAREGGAIGGEGVSVFRSVLSDNYAAFNGGGYYALAGSARIIDSVISNNTALTSGGGVYVSLADSAVIERSLITGNTSNQGAGIANEKGLVNLNQSTVVQNVTTKLSLSSPGVGGGVYGGSESDYFINNSTLYDNSASSGNNVFVDSLANSVHVKNSIIGLSDPADSCDGAAPISSGGNNIETSDSCSLNQPTDLVNTDPLLSELKDNGGPTLSMAVDASSPAIDAGNASSCTNTYHSATVSDEHQANTDQRGANRPVDGDGDLVSTCDIGAYEFVPSGINSHPIAHAGADLIVRPNSTVTLNGEHSQDLESETKSFQWQQLVGTPVSIASDNEAVLTFQASDVSGTLTFGLSVTDEASASDEDSVDVVVNSPPLANAGEDVDVIAGSRITFNSEQSTDPDGIISSRDWSLIWGIYSSAHLSLSGMSPTIMTGLTKENSSLVYRLTTTDNLGFTDSDLVVAHVYVEKDDVPPVANAGSDIDALPGQAIRLDGSGSHDSDRDVRKYIWQSADNIRIWNSNESIAFITAPIEEGAYKVDLVVVDNGNLAAADSIVINVGAKSNQTPLVVDNSTDESETSAAPSIGSDLPFGGGALGGTVILLSLLRVYGLIHRRYDANQS
ncbi:PKD domain-containing protein [Pseudomonadota bacterium]